MMHAKQYTKVSIPPFKIPPSPPFPKNPPSPPFSKGGLEGFLDEKGMVLVVGLLLIVVLMMIGTTAVMTSTTDMKISGNYKTSNQAFYAAEAGINEALYRLGLFDDGTKAPPSGSMISINSIAGNNAAINIDPNGLLSNGIDDDVNGAVDDISDLNYNGTYDNRNWRAKIMLSSSAPAGLVGNTTFFTNTVQPSGNWIEYSSSTDGGTVLTIEFLKDTGDMDGDGNTSEIVFYDGSLATPLNVNTPATPASGQPVVVITSTGKAPGGSIKKLQVRAVYQPINVNAEAAVMVKLNPTLTGSAIISGFNYDGSTTSANCAGSCGPAQWDSLPGVFNTNGIDNHGGKESYTYPNPSPPPPNINYNGNDINTTLLPATAAPNNQEELDEETKIPYGTKLESSGHKPGVWTPLAAGTVLPEADVFGGNNTTPWKVEAAPAWLTLAEVLGVSSEVLTGILAAANVTEADMNPSGILSVAPQGVIYINNAGGNLLKVTSATPNSDQGWGLMYIKGDVNFQNLEFKGLIYVEGDASITGSFWLMGCITIKGVTAGNFSASAGTFLYSADALKNYTNKGMKFKTLSWYDNPS